MKKCPNCGTETKDTAKFCPACGFSLTPQENRKCPGCGTEVRDREAFCPNCGRNLQENGKDSGDFQDNPAITEAVDTSQDLPQPQKMPAGISSGQPQKQNVFCPNCGERVPFGTGFCPNCGTAIQGKPKKKYKPLIATAAVIAAVALICLGAMTSMRLFMPVDKKFLKYHKDMLSGRMLENVEHLVNSLDQGGISSDLTVTASTDSVLVNGFLNNTELLLKLDADNGELTVNGELDIAGTKILSASAFYDDGKAGVYIPELDQNQYVCNLEEMLEYNTDIPDISGEELREVIEPYLDVLFTAVNKNNISVEKSEIFDLDVGGTYKGDIYVFRPRAEDVTRTITEFANLLEKDDDLRELLYELATPVILDELGMGSVKEIDGAINDVVYELMENAVEAGRSFADLGLTWRLYVKGNTVHRIGIGISEYPDMIVFEDTGEKDGTRSMNLSFYDGYDYYSMANSYTKEGGVYSGTMSLTFEGEDVLSLGYRTGNKNRSTLGIPYGSYDLIVPGTGSSISIDVSDGGSEGDLHKLIIDGLAEESDGMVNTLSVNINATEKGTPKRADGPYVDITNYTDRELEDLAERLGEAFNQNIASQFGPLFN